MKSWELTPFGLEVRKKLLEKNSSIADLAREVGANASYLRGMMYGYRSGKKYVNKICEFLGMDDEVINLRQVAK